MSVEIEAKMKVDDPAPVRARLEALGARRMGRALETNVFFDTADHALRAKDHGLRIRHSKPLDGENREKVVMTFKGAQQHGELKRREEIEITIDDLDAGARLLDRLGYQRDLGFEKRRESWQLDGCKIELDELPQGLGAFVEIEGPAHDVVMRVRERLALADRALIKKSYIAMVAEHVRATGSKARFVTFAG